MPALSELREQMQEANITRVDLRVTDLLGRWHHFAVPADQLTDEAVRYGFGVDGSSLRGFRSIEESDMLLRPDLDTAVIDPLDAVPTLAVVCDVVDPLTEDRYARDPRYVATKAEAFLLASGIADTAFFGPELGFFVFDEARFQLTSNTAFYFVDSDEAHWNQGGGQGPNLAYKIGEKQGYSPTPPLDSLAPLRWQIAEALAAVGVPVEAHHHEVASAGQCEISMRYATPVRKADDTQWYRYLARNVARAHGKAATFMPKPVFGDNGSGMHTHQSLWKDGSPLFHDSNGYAGLSRLARYYIGGLLTHAPALLAFTSPSTNSYKRLLPGYEAPVYLAYSMGNRSAAIRIPAYAHRPHDQRIEFRPPDGTANPYLAFAAMLMAGLDGIRREIDPGDPIERNLDALTEAEAARVRRVPGSLTEALDALEADHAFLLEGNVFTIDLITRWTELKRDEVRGLRERPSPYEFELYFNG